MNQINDKIKEINEFLAEFKNIIPSNFNEYKSNIEKKAACERYFEKIVEAATDLAFLIIKQKKLKIPEDDISSFSILLENKIISKNLASKLKDAKGMRNILSHQYGSIDDELVFKSIKNELESDIKEFIKETASLIK